MAETTFLERLEKEEQELGDKIVKLNSFLHKDNTANVVSSYQFELLSLQHSTMVSYRKVLIMRISDLKKQATN